MIVKTWDSLTQATDAVRCTDNSGMGMAKEVKGVYT